MKTYIGIDPGLRGGIAIIGEETMTFPMPIDDDGEISETELRDIIMYTNKGIDKIIIVEKVHSMPRQGVKSMFTFGHGCGKIKATIKLLGLPYRYVHPQVWQKKVCPGYGNPKLRVLISAKQLFPNVDFKNHGGMIDALLIAEYGRVMGL